MKYTESAFLRTALGAAFLLLCMVGPFVGAVSAEGFSNIAKSPTELDERYLRMGGNVPVKSIAEVFEGQGEVTRGGVKVLLGMPNDPLSNEDDHDWFYSFNLPLNDENNLVCQFKVSFSQEVVASAQWRRYQCGALFEDLRAQAKDDVVTLSADLLFAFDDDTVSAEGERTIANLVRDARSKFVDPMFSVIGYTDRIGSHGYNLELSEQRAVAVSEVIQSLGVSSQRAVAEGRGEADPATQCSQSLSRNELVRCLAPDRRVEVFLGEGAYR